VRLLISVGKGGEETSTCLASCFRFAAVFLQSFSRVNVIFRAACQVRESFPIFEASYGSIQTGETHLQPAR
jgi:hypothetical protein